MKSPTKEVKRKNRIVKKAKTKKVTQQKKNLQNKEQLKYCLPEDEFSK